MTNRRTLHRLAGVLAFWVAVCAPSPASAQDPLARAKTFYASADYEEALQALEALKGKPASTEASAYQVFCLVALGRRDEARVVIEAIVRTDPLFRPSEIEVAPRIRAFYNDVRAPLLPEVARVSYGRAKTAFDKKDWAAANGEFDRVIALLDEIGGTDQGVIDLRTLASGFRDLAVAATVTAAAAPAPTPAPKSDASTTSATPATSEKPADPPPAPTPEPAIYGAQHANVVAPIPISKRMPEWAPNIVEQRMTFSGDIELVISEEGKVLLVTLLKSVNPRYDGPLLEAAKTWTFQPATKNGVPVKYRYTMTVRLVK